MIDKTLVFQSEFEPKCAAMCRLKPWQILQISLRAIVSPSSRSSVFIDKIINQMLGVSRSDWYVHKCKNWRNPSSKRAVTRHPTLWKRDPRATMNHHSPIYYLWVILQGTDQNIAFSVVQSTSPGKIATKRHGSSLHVLGHAHTHGSTHDLFLFRSTNNCWRQQTKWAT